MAIKYLRIILSNVRHRHCLMSWSRCTLISSDNIRNIPLLEIEIEFAYKCKTTFFPFFLSLPVAPHWDWPFKVWAEYAYCSLAIFGWHITRRRHQMRKVIDLECNHEQASNSKNYITLLFRLDDATAKIRHADRQPGHVDYVRLCVCVTQSILSFVPNSCVIIRSHDCSKTVVYTQSETTRRRRKKLTEYDSIRIGFHCKQSERERLSRGTYLQWKEKNII